MQKVRRCECKYPLMITFNVRQIRIHQVKSSAVHSAGSVALPDPEAWDRQAACEFTLAPSLSISQSPRVHSRFNSHVTRKFYRNGRACARSTRLKPHVSQTSSPRLLSPSSQHSHSSPTPREKVRISLQCFLSTLILTSFSTINSSSITPHAYHLDRCSGAPAPARRHRLLPNPDSGLGQGRRDDGQRTNGFSSAVSGNLPLALPTRD